MQGRLVSGSWTPQCLLGSNTLPGKQQTASADPTRPILPLPQGSSQGGGSPGTQASFVSFPTRTLLSSVFQPRSSSPRLGDIISNPTPTALR